MLRELKFRAWDAEQNHMLRADLLEQGWLVKELNNPKFNVMQFTGLRDKNGREIYEGDILSSHSYGNCKVIWPEKYITSDNEDILAWCIEPLDLMKYGGIHGLDVQYTWEIIGNIHENKDLLV